MAYKDFSPERKKGIAASVKRRRQKIRHDLIELHGGKCSKCGYSKCEAALEFHHKDPTQKHFSVATSSKSWELIKEEADKCTLLCANCHRETHNGM